MSSKRVKMEKDSLPIREFRLESMCPNPAICMIAKRGSGKSWLVRDIMNHFRKIPCGMVISKTEKMNPFYKEFFPDSYIYYEYDTDVVGKFLNRQDMILEKAREKAKKGKKVDPRAFLIMDDCLADGNLWKKDKNIQEIFFNGRHYKLMYILTMQYPLGIGPDLRLNFDYVFLLADDNFMNTKKLYEQYAGMFPDVNTFRQVFNQLTKDYGCMVIANRGGKRDTILDKIFYYKAKNPTFHDDIGCRQFKEYHKNNYDKEWKSKMHYDMNKLCSKKGKPSINVTKITNDNDDDEKES